MSTTKLNLIDGHFQNSNLFHHLPIFDEINYLGLKDGKIQTYRAVREGQPCVLLALSIIRKEEDILWEAAEDLLERCVKEATPRLQGVFTFDLLTFDIHREVKSFNYTEFSTLIVNHSLKTPPGGERLVKYLSAYGILRKLVTERWGKIVFKTSIEVFKDDPTFLYSLASRMFKLAEFPRDPLILLINDLSNEPLFDRTNKNQQEFLSKLIAEREKNVIEFLPEVYIQDRKGVRELMSATELKTF
jgi:hypothetical protein